MLSRRGLLDSLRFIHLIKKLSEILFEIELNNSTALKAVKIIIIEKFFI